MDVVDGDTLKLQIDLGFHINYRTTVRLARINTPETVTFTIQGLKDPAKEFVMQACGPGAVIVVNISKPDKYGRWLADVFYLPGSRSRDEILGKGRNLNNELLQNGLAKPY